RNADFVASGTKFRGAHERLKKRLLVKFWLRLDQLLIDVLQDAVGAVGERIMDRLVDRVVGISDGAVDVRDGVARGAGNAGLGGRMFYVIVIGVVKSPAEEGHHIVTTRAP